MGGYYTQNDREHPSVVNAISEHYLLVLLEIKLKVLRNNSCTCRSSRYISWYIYHRASALVQDPFAIRRTCLGLLNIILENDIDIDLREAINFAGNLVSGQANQTMHAS